MTDVALGGQTLIKSQLCHFILNNQKMFRGQKKIKLLKKFWIDL